MAAAAVGTVALGTAALLDLGPFAPAEPRVLEVADRLEDCRAARRDHGDRCDAGADVEAIRVWPSDDGTLMVVLQLADAPDLGPDLEWTAEFYVDMTNAYTEGGIICGLSNLQSSAAGDGEPQPEAVSYALDPDTVPRKPLAPSACSGRLEGSSVRFSIDVTDQPDDAGFRLIGVVRLEYPGDPEHPGSEDDFLVRTSLAELRG